MLPTRERVMEHHHETGSLLALAERAEQLGFDSIWVGDSVTARPRHDPLTLLAAVAARTKKAELGTAVLLPGRGMEILSVTGGTFHFFDNKRVMQSNCSLSPQEALMHWACREDENGKAVPRSLL